MKLSNLFYLVFTLRKLEVVLNVVGRPSVKTNLGDQVSERREENVENGRDRPYMYRSLSMV